MPISRLSFLDSMTDLAQAMKTGNPAVMVRNKDSVQPIIDAYLNSSNSSIIPEYIALIQFIALGALVCLLIAVLTIKILEIRVDLSVKKVLELYGRLDDKHIADKLAKMGQFKAVLKGVLHGRATR